MDSLFMCLIALAGVLAGHSHADAQGTETEARHAVERCAFPRSGLETPEVLEPLLREMCRRSPMFRRQLVRLANMSGLVVTLAIGTSRMSGNVAATTRIVRKRGVLERADVEISDTHIRDVVELIAHEFEHVIEQLDDVNLAHMAEGPGVTVTSHRAGRAFETARARLVGRSVATEFNGRSSPHAIRQVPQ